MFYFKIFLAIFWPLFWLFFVDIFLVIFLIFCLAIFFYIFFFFAALNKKRGTFFDIFLAGPPGAGAGPRPGQAAARSKKCQKLCLFFCKAQQQKSKKMAQTNVKKIGQQNDPPPSPTQKKCPKNKIGIKS